MPPLGKFKITKRKARDGRNPTTGATIKIPAVQRAEVPAVEDAEGRGEQVSPAPIADTSRGASKNGAPFAFVTKRMLQSAPATAKPTRIKGG